MNPDAPRLTQFGQLDRWFDELSLEEQAEFRRGHPPLEILDCPLLPKDHGDTLEEQLGAARMRFDVLQATREPFYLVRISDCEVAAMGCGYFAHSPHPQATEAAMHHVCGFDRSFLQYRPELLRAFQDASLLGLQQNWMAWRLNTIALFRLLGWPVPHPRGVEVHLPYRMLIDGSLFSFLAGKRVLLVGGLADRLADAFRLRRFQDAHRRFGLIEQVASVSAIRTPSRGERGGACEGLHEVWREVRSREFDVALLSAGTAAKLLARRIWELGKVALDVGFVFDALLGDPERTVRPALRDVSWPVGEYF